MNKKILIVEDEPDIANLLALHLEGLCERCEVAADGHEGMRLALRETWDLVVLDICLPGPDGLDICKAIRTSERYTPVLMLTSKSAEFDRVLGLEIGADDYMGKPFVIQELVARVKAIFRRVAELCPADSVRCASRRDQGHSWRWIPLPRRRFAGRRGRIPAGRK